jgi:hypothetical protein
MTERMASSGSRSATAASSTTGTDDGPMTSGTNVLPGPTSIGLLHHRAMASVGVTTRLFQSLRLRCERSCQFQDNTGRLLLSLDYLSATFMRWTLHLFKPYFMGFNMIPGDG